MASSAVRPITNYNNPNNSVQIGEQNIFVNGNQIPDLVELGLIRKYHDNNSREREE
jgi:hypothetical protein